MSEREQLVNVMMRALCEHHYGQAASSCDEEQEGDSYVREEMYAILAEIEAAGYVLMDRGRAERLRQAAAVVLEWYPVLQDAAVTPPKPEYRLRPGDTDPLEGGE